MFPHRDQISLVGGPSGFCLIQRWKQQQQSPLILHKLDVGALLNYKLRKLLPTDPGIKCMHGHVYVCTYLCTYICTCPGAHPASCTMGIGSFPGVKCGRGVLLTTHLLLVPRSWKSRAIPLPTLWATPGL